MKKTFITALLGGALMATPAMAWEKGENVPDVSKYDALSVNRFTYNTPIGPIVRQSYTKDGKFEINTFSKMCDGKMKAYAYYDFDTEEIALDNDPVDGVIDSVYDGPLAAPSPFAAIPDCK